MARAKKSSRSSAPSKQIFMNVPISAATRDGLHLLKEAMNAHSQAEVIERLVRMGVAISKSSQR